MVRRVSHRCQSVQPKKTIREWDTEEPKWRRDEARVERNMK
jgi:hypothetical protein